jgi:hypothetical protein
MTSPPRHFTPAEVDALIPRLRAIMERVRSAHQQALAIRDRLRAEQQRINFSGGGVVDQAQWRQDTEAAERARRALEKGLEQIHQLGGVPKDLELGLVDFPHLRRGEEVHLCWKYGEDAVGFWHGLTEGYAGRKPL